MGILYKAVLKEFNISHTVDDQPQQKGFEMHLHDHLEIYLFISGKAKYVVEGNEYDLSPGNLLLLRDSESHCINFLNDSPYERYVLHLNPAFIDAVDPQHQLLQPFYDRPLGVDNMYRPSEFPNTSALSYFKSMCIETDDNYNTRLAVMTNLLPLLRDVGSAFQKRKEPDLHSSVTGQITAYINEHLFEDISVQTIASQFFMSVSQIERIFKK